MSPITTRSQKEDEDSFDVDEIQDAPSSQPAISDSRRRRLRARGIEPVEVSAEDSREDVSDVRDLGVTAAKGRPTPARGGVVQPSTNPFVRFIEGVREYIHDVRSELGKVTWLTREEVLRLGYIVLAVTVSAAIFLGLLSFLFGLLAGAVQQASTSVAAGLFVIAIIVVVAVGWLVRERLFPDTDFDDREASRPRTRNPKIPPYV